MEHDVFPIQLDAVELLFQVLRIEREFVNQDLRNHALIIWIVPEGDPSPERLAAQRIAPDFINISNVQTIIGGKLQRGIFLDHPVSLSVEDRVWSNLTVRFDAAVSIVRVPVIISLT